jgi:hypothetical protein
MLLTSLYYVHYGKDAGNIDQQSSGTTFSRQLPHNLSKGLAVYGKLKVNYYTEKKLSKRVIISSSGWISNFKECHHLHNYMFMGEAKIADQVAEVNFPNELQKIVKENGYMAKKIFNVDEMGLF